MRKFDITDPAYYAARYYNPNQEIDTPDWNATLYWEFRDSAGVLQFTATTTSIPALAVGSDSVGDFVEIQGIDLTGWAEGVVEVRRYAQFTGVPTEPSPEISYAFEVIASGTMIVQLRELLHLDDASQDPLLESLLDAATEYASKYLGRTLLTATRTKQVVAPVNQGLSISMLKWPTILLTYPPVEDITRVYTVDRLGNETDIDADRYWLDDVSDPPELKLNYSYSNILRVEYVAGYGPDYSSLPDAIQRGILMHAAYMFKYRGDCPDGESAEKSGAVSAYRIYRVVRRG